MRRRNNNEEIDSFYPSFENNRREMLIGYCKGFGRALSVSIIETESASQLRSELINMYRELRESLVGTCPRRYIETPRRNRHDAPGQGPC